MINERTEVSFYDKNLLFECQVNILSHNSVGKPVWNTCPVKLIKAGVRRWRFLRHFGKETILKVFSYVLNLTFDIFSRYLMVKQFFGEDYLTINTFITRKRLLSLI